MTFLKIKLLIHCLINDLQPLLIKPNLFLCFYILLPKSYTNKTLSSLIYIRMREIIDKHF